MDKASPCLINVLRPVSGTARAEEEHVKSVT